MPKGALFMLTFSSNKIGGVFFHFQFKVIPLWGSNTLFYRKLQVGGLAVLLLLGFQYFQLNGKWLFHLQVL